VSPTYTVRLVELSLWIIVGLLLLVGVVLLARAGRRAEAAIAAGVLAAMVIWLIAFG
jgi:cytochrome c-type biogenesis protein CcmH/NrfF